MSDPLLLVPKHFTRVKVFEAREVFMLEDDGAGGQHWVRVADESTPSLEDQIDEWLTATANLVQNASSPVITALLPTPDSKCYVTTCTVVYVPALEGADAHGKENDIQRKIAAARNAQRSSTGSEASGGDSQKTVGDQKSQPPRKALTRPSPQMGGRRG